MNRILITDGLWRKSVVAIRSLGKENLKITVTGTSLFTSGFYSRYCNRKLITTDPKVNPKVFFQQIKSELTKNKYDLLITMEDATIKALLPHRHEIEKLTRFPLPNNKSFEIASDKEKTLKFAKKINIDIPQTYFNISKIDTNKITLPVIIKPTISSGSRGLQYINTIKTLTETVKKIKKTKTNAVIQERIPQDGQEVGVNLLFNHQHQAVAGFTYKRIRDYPVSGGPSTLRESTHNPALMQTAIKLLEKLKWVGVAMVEFKYDPRDNKTKLMEINPRFWGSLALPVAAKINFPYLLYLQETNQKITPTFTYPVGIRARWLIPGDILHFLSNPNRFSLVPSFFNFFDKNTYYDDFDITDPIGNLAVIICTFIQSFNPKMWKIVFNRGSKK